MSKKIVIQRTEFYKSNGVMRQQLRLDEGYFED